MLKWKCLLIAFILCSIFLRVQAQQFEMMHDGVTRTYVVYEPDNLDQENLDAMYSRQSQILRV